MKTWKKFAALTSLLCVTAVLGACNGASNETKTNDDGKTIVTLGRQTIQNSKLPEGDTYEDNAYTRLIEKELDIDLQSAFEANGDDYSRQVSLAIASGDMPDMMLVDTREELEELVDNDLVADLTEAYDKHGSDNLKEIYASYDEIPIEDATFDGKLMAIPATSVDFGPSIVWIRQDWVDQLGMKIDTDNNKVLSLDELKTITKTFVEKDPGGTGNPVGLALNYWLTAPGYGSSTYLSTPIMHSFGAYPKYYLTGDDGKMFYGSNTEETKAALAYLKEWFDEGLLDPQFGTRTFDDITAMVINGETGVVPGPWHLPDWNLFQVRETNPDVNFVPYTIENQNGDGKINSISDKGTGKYIVVNKEFANPELAVDIVNIFYDKLANSDDLEKEYPEVYEYGKIGVDGTARPFNCEINNADSQLEDAVAIADAVDDKIAVDELPNFGSKENALTIKKYLEDPQNAESSAWAKYNSIYQAEAHVMATTKAASLLNELTPPKFNNIKASTKNGAQLNKLEEETFLKFITGETSLDKFDEYVKTWEKQGGADVLSEMQEVIDTKK